MNIPAPDEFARQHGYNPFPGRWGKWLGSVREAVLSAQPIAGRHVTCDEHPGKGTVINVERRPGVAGEPPTGACCIGEDCTITTEAECAGIWQGPETVCDPNPCLGEPTGACCIDGVCTITTAGECAGTWMGAGTDCDPSPCGTGETGACCYCFWDFISDPCVCNPTVPVCSAVTQAECSMFLGIYEGDGAFCGDFDCDDILGGTTACRVIYPAAECCEICGSCNEACNGCA